MSRPYFLKDNSFAAYSEQEGGGLCLPKKSKICEELVNKTLEQLEAENSSSLFIIPSLDEDTNLKDAQVLRGVKDGVRTSNLMGFVGVDDEELVIGSRFAGDDEASDHFLHYMLSKVTGYSIVDLQFAYGKDGVPYKLLEFLFPAYLKEAMKRGVYRTYVWRDYNDDHVRGIIDIPRFIKQDVPFMGKVAYRTRELTGDNDVMELVRHTVEKLLRGSGHLAKQLQDDSMLRDFVSQVREATPRYRAQDRRKVIAANLKHPVHSRYFRGYRRLQSLCIAILMGKEVSLRGEAGKVHGILFDGAWLWEEYLDCVFEEQGLEFLHPMNKTAGGKKARGGQRYFKNLASDSEIGLIYPDFISQDDNPRIIMDAKYKRDSRSVSGDYHQLLAYMFRFDARTGVFLYPYSEGVVDDIAPSDNDFDSDSDRDYDPDSAQVLLLMQGVRWGTQEPTDRQENECIKVVKARLEVPSGCSSFEDFSAEMNGREKDLVDIVRKSSGEGE